MSFLLDQIYCQFHKIKIDLNISILTVRHTVRAVFKEAQVGYSMAKGEPVAIDTH